MKYSIFDEKELTDWKKLTETIEKAPNKLDAKLDTAYFAKHFLGIVPYSWQYNFWKKLDIGTKRVIVASPRQVGKSMAISIFALKSAMFDTFRAGVDNKTRVGIISATEEQSKKLMQDIRNIIWLGDDYVDRMTKGKVKGFFSNEIDDSRESSNNKSAITFKNGNTIICLPPTDKVRGYSFSYVFVDEAAFIESDVFFTTCVEPTVSKTNGYIILTSTPNGMQGFFYDLFDPEDKNEVHEYERIWLHWEMIDDPNHKKQIEDKKQFYYDTGREREFRQEYDAEFTCQVSAFFNSEDVDNGIDHDLYPYDEFSKETNLGIDFGMSNSNTVLTVIYKSDKYIQLIYQYIYPNGQDLNLLDDVKRIMGKYSVSKIIVDDCPEGYFMISQMQEAGLPVTGMKFRTEKVGKYVSFRSKLRTGKIKYYNAKELIKQMKSMQEIATPSTTKIEKPSGGKDDAVDSFVMACYYYLDEVSSFGSETLISQKKKSQFGWEEEIDRIMGKKIVLDMTPELKEEMKLWGG